MMKSMTNPRSDRRSARLLGGLRKSLSDLVGRRPAKAAAPLMIEMPALGISENEKEVRIRLEAPGFGVDDIDVRYASGALEISGDKEERREENKRGSRLLKTRRGSFRRTVPVGNDVDWDKAEARFRKGVLTVAIPKRPGSASRRRRIPVG